MLTQRGTQIPLSPAGCPPGGHGLRSKTLSVGAPLSPGNRGSTKSLCCPRNGRPGLRGWTADGPRGSPVIRSAWRGRGTPSSGSPGDPEEGTLPRDCLQHRGIHDHLSFPSRGAPSVWSFREGGTRVPAVRGPQTRGQGVAWAELQPCGFCVTSAFSSQSSFVFETSAVWMVPGGKHGCADPERRVSRGAWTSATC